jgi:hypothetical protein
METAPSEGAKRHYHGLPRPRTGDQRRSIVFITQINESPSGGNCPILYCFHKPQTATRRANATPNDKLTLVILGLQGKNFLNDPMKFDVFGDAELELNVTGLQPDTTYSIQVAALTRKGDGDRSTPVNVRTPGGVPNRPALTIK